MRIYWRGGGFGDASTCYLFRHNQNPTLAVQVRHKLSKQIESMRDAYMCTWAHTHTHRGSQTSAYTDGHKIRVQHTKKAGSSSGAGHKYSWRFFSSTSQKGRFFFTRGSRLLKRCTGSRTPPNLRCHLAGRFKARFLCRFPALFDPVKFMREHDASGFREMYLQVIGVSKFQR